MFMKKVIFSLGTAMLVAFAGISPANATSYTFDSVSMNSPSIVHLSTIGVNSDVYAGLTTLKGAGSSKDFIGFCADFFHEIHLGAQSPLLDYHSADLTTDSGGHTLSASTIGEINYLAHYGLTSTSSFVQAAVQGGIWAKLGGVVTTGDSALQSAINGFAASTFQRSAPGSAIYADNGFTQGFVNGGVPEPASWALMIVGFGLVGVASRKRRANVMVAC
jgi:hypothetical protein